MRLLDVCLHALEDDHQRGEVVVSAHLAAKLRPHLSEVAPGMLISEAIERVFAEQGQHVHMRQGQPGADRPSRPSPPSRRPSQAMVAPTPVTVTPVQAAHVAEVPAQPLDEVGARELTERIRSATQQVCMLLLEAHDRRAWSPLGYRTWERYVQREFGLSRSRSYDLLDQGRVIRELRAAAGVSGILDISAYAATQIKPYLPEVTRNIRDRAAGQPRDRLIEMIGDVVRQQRARIGALRGAGRARPLTMVAADGGDLTQLYAAIQCLAAMPPAVDTAAQIPDGAGHMKAAEPALQWLKEFVDEWRRKGRPKTVQRRSHDDDDDLAVGA